MGLKEESNKPVPSFSEILANKICGGHNQHAIVLFEGKTGTGKSYASLRLAFDCSLLFAKKLGGRPEDYFTLDNVGILTGEETLRIAKNQTVWYLHSGRRWGRRTFSQEVAE